MTRDVIRILWQQYQSGKEIPGILPQKIIGAAYEQFLINEDEWRAALDELKKVGCGRKISN